jgi:hypothetical protein
MGTDEERVDLNLFQEGPRVDGRQERSRTHSYRREPTSRSDNFFGPFRRPFSFVGVTPLRPVESKLHRLAEVRVATFLLQMNLYRRLQSHRRRSQRLDLKSPFVAEIVRFSSDDETLTRFAALIKPLNVMSCHPRSTESARTAHARRFNKRLT